SVEACAREDLLARFTDGSLPSSQLEPLERHIDSCAECRRVVGAAIGETETAPSLAEASIEPGALWGRYRILELLGAGAMSVVFAAFDPELSRRVALKVLRPGGALDRLEGQALTMREAQALARLAHPNRIPLPHARPLH